MSADDFPSSSAAFICHHYLSAVRSLNLACVTYNVCAETTANITPSVPKTFSDPTLKTFSIMLSDLIN